MLNSFSIWIKLDWYCVCPILVTLIISKKLCNGLGKNYQKNIISLYSQVWIHIFTIESDVIEKLSNDLNPNSIYQTFFIFEYTNTTTDTINIEALKLYLTQIRLHCTQPWYSIIINNNTSTHFNIKDFQTLLTTNEISLEHSTLFMIPNDMDMDERIQMLYSWFEMAPILILDTDQQRLKVNPSDNRELTNDGVPLGRGNDDERIIDDDTVVKLSDLQSGSDSPEQIVHHTRKMNISIGIPTTTYSIAHSLYVDYRPTQTIVYCSHCSLCSSRLTTLQGLVPFILYSASIECVSSNQKRYEPTGFPLQVNGLGLKCLNKGCVQPDGIRLDDHLGSIEHLIISHLIDDNRVIQLHT
ncbi:hypothetical protein BC833DRAFT_443599 [Globomyces pollinis-pini]|nr:hypothetical protein BC833DRAFT_443599 [Globomyces pollinis-pini]